MYNAVPPTVGEILSSRAGEEMALNDRYLNPQMGRILRTLGFDKQWRTGEGAHLIDADAVLMASVRPAALCHFAAVFHKSDFARTNV